MNGEVGMNTELNENEVCDLDDGKERFIADLQRRLALVKIIFLQSAIFKSSYFTNIVSNAKQNAKSSVNLESKKVIKDEPLEEG
jgi:hypothetical protein